MKDGKIEPSNELCFDLQDVLKKSIEIFISQIY